MIVRSIKGWSAATSASGVASPSCRSHSTMRPPVVSSRVPAAAPVETTSTRPPPAGAVAGAEVVIGDGDRAVVFDWEPTLMTGSELLGGPRGTDMRLDDHNRPTRGEKRKEYKDRMDAKTEAREELWQERQAGHWSDPED